MPWPLLLMSPNAGCLVTNHCLSQHLNEGAVCTLCAHCREASQQDPVCQALHEADLPTHVLSCRRPSQG